jgi:hypothetical protein
MAFVCEGRMNCQAERWLPGMVHVVDGWDGWAVQYRELLIVSGVRLRAHLHVIRRRGHVRGERPIATEVVRYDQLRIAARVVLSHHRMGVDEGGVIVHDVPVWIEHMRLEVEVRVEGVTTIRQQRRRRCRLEG